MSHEEKELAVRGDASFPRLRSPDRQSRGNFDDGDADGVFRMEIPSELAQTENQAEQLFPSSNSTSTLSSSPPRDFDVGPESQYMPILDDDHEDDSNDDEDEDEEQDYADEDFLDGGPSGHYLAPGAGSSTHQATSHHDYDSSPVVFNAITSSHRAHLQRQNQHQAKTVNSSRVIRCPVCEKPMRTFYCAKCIQTGRFVTLDHNQRAENRFSQTIIEHNNSESSRLDNARPECGLSLPGCGIVSKPVQAIEEEMLQIKLRALIRKTDALKALYNEQQVKLEQTRRLLEMTRQQVEAEKKSHRSKASKIELIKRYIASRKASVKKREDAKVDCLEDLRQHASRRVYQLTQDVFPLDEVNLFEQQNSSFVNMETSPLLTFSDGSHHQIEHLTAYSIVEPWLPSNGDYSAYSLWVNDNKDQLQAPMEEYSPERSPAFRIGAALAYTTQFVRNLANYLDVILPAQMNLDMFSRELLEDVQFSYNVAKLNANVIHLCVSQGVDLSLLNAHRTLKNLSLLFNMNLSDLGRKPIIDLESVEEVAQRIECHLANDLAQVREDLYDFSKFSNDDEDERLQDEGDGTSDSEWEISDNISSPVDLQLAEQSRIAQQSSYISRPLRLFSSFWAASGSG